MLKHALAYAAKGWYVFPLRPRTKVPLTQNGLNDASIDPAQVTEWWTKWPDANIAIRTGKISGFIVVDVDSKNNGLRNWADLVAACGDANTGAVAKTGGGGAHRLYQYPSEGEVRNSAGKLTSGVDVRGDGGYIVAAPSIHESGSLYEWEAGFEPSPIPEWLREQIIAKPRVLPAVVAETTADGFPTNLAYSTLKFLAQGPNIGEWNHTLFKSAKDWQQHGGSESAFTSAAEKITGHLDEKDLATIRSAFSKPPSFEPRPAVVLGDKPKAADIAHAFMNSTEFGRLLKTWQKGFYEWDGTKYAEVTVDDVRHALTRWFNELPPTKISLTPGLVDSIIMNCTACYVKSTIRTPAWLDGKGADTRSIIAMQNGLVNIDSLLAGGEVQVTPHTPNFFNFSCLPYAYDKSATCPTWLKFLEEIQPDADVRALLQEWFGYNLVFDYSFQKFALFEGDGSNGKGVCLKVLTELIGQENVSNVGLEAFTGERTFNLASMNGKLANIVGDLNEVDRPQEGLLKALTGGDPVTVERKFKDPFNLVPTARFTFSTNTLPRFTDKSSGLWRRLLYVPFHFQILDEKKQDKRLGSSDFWRRSGELPGIFNWAIEGLARLRANDAFTVAKVSAEAAQKYRDESNPVQTWLRENYEEGTETDYVTKLSVYEAYKDFAAESGLMTPAIIQFGREIPRIFKEVSEGIKKVDKKTSKVWIGLKAKQDTTPPMPGKLEGILG